MAKCKYILKQEGVPEKDWPVFKSKEALATHLNKTPALEEALKSAELNEKPDSNDAKKADIERRRQEELKNRVVYDRFPTLEDGEFKIIGDPNNRIYRINENTGRPQELDRDNGLWSNTALNPNLFLESTKRSGFEKSKDKINAKYDSELSALENEEPQEGDITVNGEISPVVTIGEAGEQGEGVQPAADVTTGTGEVIGKQSDDLKESERVVYDREPTAEDGVYKILGDPNNTIYRVNPNTGRIQEYSDGLWSNTASNAIARGTARKEGFQKIKDPSAKTEQSNEAKKTEVTATTEGGENMREANSQEPNEIFTQVDEAINKTGVEATTARRELKEKFGTDNYQKAIKITREFEKIITRLEAEGKITKKCP